MPAGQPSRQLFLAARQNSPVASVQSHSPLKHRVRRLPPAQGHFYTQVLEKPHKRSESAN